jgi:lysozyme
VIATARDLIIKHEAVRPRQYNDDLGIPTIGVGHNLQASPLPAGWVEPLTQVQIDTLLDQDIAHASAALTTHVPGFSGIASDARRAVLLDMSFEMGWPRLSQFVHFLDAVQRQDWQGAHDHMLASKWALQVPKRASEDAAMILSGDWPTEERNA